MMILFTKPFLPSKKSYQEYLDAIWNRVLLTNNGPLVQELEHRLGEYLHIGTPLFVTNGTVALQIAIKALGLSGEVITTPFSYVATTSSLVWEGCRPVFVDIDPLTLNIDPHRIEAAITAQTTGILATHVFGNPCDIDAIQSIADKHGLKVIYDAAHGFGSTYKGHSVFDFGDISTTSFHATKLFHTIEGGAVFTRDTQLRERMSLMRNFGHAGFETFDGVGINGKNSEFHAAMGLANLTYIDEILHIRQQHYELYLERLSKLPLQLQSIQQDSQWNFSYFPIVLQDQETMLRVKELLESHAIYPRRYFYPSLATLDYVDTLELPELAISISERILCLPMYHSLERDDQNKICELLERVLV
jgi:dTDP-4-amino-4,6-dideoxygalactose transaminase